MNPDAGVYPYCYCELLSADPLVDAKTGESRVGLTIADPEGDGTVSFCFSVPDAMRMVDQLNKSLLRLAEAG